MSVANGIPGTEIREGEATRRPIQRVGANKLAVVGLFPWGPLNTPTTIMNETELAATFGAEQEVSYSYAPRAARGFLRNQGGILSITRIAGSGAKASTATISDRAATPAATIRIDALYVGKKGDEITYEVVDAANGSNNAFGLVFKLGSRVERFDNLSMDLGAANYFATVINNGTDQVAKSKLVRVTNLNSPTAAPNNMPALTQQPMNLSGGDDGITVTDADYIGTIDADGNRTGLVATQVDRTINMVAIPGVTSDAVVTALLDHAFANGRMAIPDLPVGLSPAEAKTFREKFASSNAAIYYPWVVPVGSSRMYPPSAWAAGVWARVGATKGIEKPPGNEILMDVQGLEYDVDDQQAVLNPVGVNCIRRFAGEGILLWGVRTMSSDPQWRYIHKRRIFLNVAQSVEQGTRWAVFQPNDEELWAQIERDVDAFLRTLKRPYARTLVDYFVQCDAETNPKELVDQGQVNTKIGLQMPGAAEFIVYEISQWEGGSSLTEAGAAPAA